jgi:hypothetical protein
MSILSQIIAYSPNKIDTETKARSLVQGPRNMYASGQLVSNTVDGSRPGYSGLGKNYKGKADFITIDGAKYRKISEKNNPNVGKFVFTERKDGKTKQLYLTEKQLKERVKNRYKNVSGWSKYGANATDNIEEYRKKYYQDNKKEEVKTEAGKLAKDRDKKLKNFLGKKKKIKASVLKDYLLNDLGYEKYDSTKIKVKFPNLLIEQDLKQGNVFKPLTKQQKTLIKESFDLPEGVKDWNFKKYRFGISSDEHMNLTKQMERRIGGGQKYTLAASFDKPQGWMMSAMERVYNNETVLKDGKRVLKENVKNLTYEPIQKGNLIVGFKDNTVAGDGKTYYGTKKNAKEFGDGTEWESHGDFKKINKFIDIANGVKAQPDEVLQKILNKKGLNIKGLTLNDVLSHQRYYGTLAKIHPKELIKRQIVLHHSGGVGDKILTRAAATKDIQLLSGAVNAEVVNLENIVKGTKKNPARALTNAEKLDLKKLGAKITDFDGKVVGGGFLDPDRQFAAIEKKALDYAKGDQFNVKTVANYLERLGCGGKFGGGGRINFAKGVPELSSCGKKGVTKLENGLKNGFKNADDAVLARGILKSGKFLKDAVSLRGLFGPLALGFTVAAEAGFVGYDMLSSGKSFREAVGDSVFNYALGDKTKIDSEEEIIKRLQNIKTGPQNYQRMGDEEIGKMQYFKENLKDLGTGFDLYNKLGAIQKNRDAISMSPEDAFNKGAFQLDLDKQEDAVRADIRDYNKTGTPNKVTDYLLSDAAKEGADATALANLLVEQDRLQDAGIGNIYQSRKGDEKRIQRGKEIGYEIENLLNPNKLDEFGEYFISRPQSEQSKIMSYGYREGGIASLNVNKK